MQVQQQYLDSIIDPSFQGAIRLILPFEDNTVRIGLTVYFQPTVEITGYKIMIDD